MTAGAKIVLDSPAIWTFTPLILEASSFNSSVTVAWVKIGTVSALQARELGLRPVILEKMPTVGGNTMRASSGMNAAETNIQLREGIVDSFAEFYQETYQGGGRLNDPELLN